VVVRVEREERQRVGEGELVAAERLERAGAAEESAREARLGLEREGALLGDGLVVHGAELEEAGRAVAVEDGAVGVAARGEAERQLVLVQRPGVVARLEQAVALLLELVRARRPRRPDLGRHGGRSWAGTGAGARRAGDGDARRPLRIQSDGEGVTARGLGKIESNRSEK